MKMDAWTRVFEKVRPRSLVGGGTSVFVRQGLGLWRSSLWLVSTPFAGGSRAAWGAGGCGWGCALGGFNVVGGSSPSGWDATVTGTVWNPHTLGCTWSASLPHARCLGLYEVLGGRNPGLRGFFCRLGSLATQTEASQGHKSFNFQISNPKF